MKILIVDDEMTVLKKMESVLLPYGECTLATSAEQALKLCAGAVGLGAPFDLITIDIHLQDSNGLDLLAALNKMEKDKAVPVAKKIMVTASGTKDNLLKAVTKGCDGFIVKPVKRDIMEQKMASLGFVKNSQETPEPGSEPDAESTPATEPDQSSPQ